MRLLNGKCYDKYHQLQVYTARHCYDEKVSKTLSVSGSLIAVITFN